MCAYESIPEQRCRELLRRDTVGRVSFSTPAGTRLVPVAYRAHDTSVSFRTAEFSELATYAPGTEVCLEIDHLDNGRRGWRVKVRGVCRKDVDSVTLDEEGAPGFVGLTGVWGTGAHAVVLTLDWTALTGQEVAAR